VVNITPRRICIILMIMRIVRIAAQRWRVKKMTKHDVVQFTEHHKWAGCLGIIVKVKDYGVGHPRRYMIGITIPERGTAYIFDDGSNIERIGKAVLVEREEDEADD
jgi:hypothetical protein